MKNIARPVIAILLAALVSFPLLAQQKKDPWAAC